MDVSFIDDRLAWGRNLAARRMGSSYDAYRPRGASEPLAPPNRFLRLHAAFSAAPGNFNHTAVHGNALHYGYFDSAYTRRGDYLVQDDRIYFIASQESLLPVLCVRANRTLTFHRPASPAGAGQSGYGGITSTSAALLAANWPASVLGMATGGMSVSGLPADTVMAQWTILLPPTLSIAPEPSDLIVDGDGHKVIVISAESTYLGWRVIARQAST